MIKIEYAKVMNLEGAIRGARNPMNSWGRIDSRYNENGDYILGENDLSLAIRLCNITLLRSGKLSSTSF